MLKNLNREVKRNNLIFHTTEKLLIIRSVIVVFKECHIAHNFSPSMFGSITCISTDSSSLLISVVNNFCNTL